MNKIDLKLQEVQKKGKIGFMTHVVVGYPSIQETIKLVELMEECGVDIVELQIPFSDPLADGPTIMQASEKALQNGTKVQDAFALARYLNSHLKIPFLFMCYYNTVFKYGIEKFCEDASKAGVSGLIVPDMPLDEETEEHFYYFAKKHNLHTIQVISPASTNERLQKISREANGFVYCTARQGITGVRQELEKRLEDYLKIVRKYIKIPIAVGFGISQKEHINALLGKVDIAVIGSKIIDIVSTSDTYKKDVGDFLKELNVLK